MDESSGSVGGLAPVVELVPQRLNVLADPPVGEPWAGAALGAGSCLLRPRGEANPASVSAEGLSG